MTDRDPSSLWSARRPDAQSNGNAISATEACAEAISLLLRKHWSRSDPTPECFDYDDARVATLLSFIDGKTTAGTTNDVRAHLVGCPRCRFIYARLHNARVSVVTDAATKANDDRDDEIPEIIRTHLRSDGIVVFPGGHVAEGAWEFGRLRTLPEELAEDISEAIAERALQRLRLVVPRHHIVIVCFSQPMHRCGKRLASKLVRTGASDVHVVMADDFFAPKLWCDPTELGGRHVIVMLDVVHSGGLLRRLFGVCRQGCPEDLVGLAVVNQSGATTEDGDPLLSLWQEAPEERTVYDARRHRDARFFDPAAGVSQRQDGLPSEVANPQNARRTIEHHLTDIAPLLPYIKSTGALKQDVQIGGVFYPWAIDLLCLLRDDEARAELATHAMERLADLAKRGPWCLVYPAARHQRAGAWAELVATTFGWPIVKVGRKSCTHYQPLTPAQQRALAKWPRALIVDAAVRTGKTAQSLVSVLRRAKLPPVRDIAAFYAFDGLFDEQRNDLQDTLQVEVRCLFRLPLGAPTEPVGRHCWKRLKDTLVELNDARCREHALWADPVRAYCKKKLDRIGRPSKPQEGADVELSFRRALDEGRRGAQARLEHACHPPRPSLVKHLDVTYALREPRTRNVLHGFLCNSMPPEFIEWCAMALATQDDYEWLDRDWFILHKGLLANAASSRWLFLACVSYWLRRDGNEQQLQRVRRALHEFRESQATTQPGLFPEPVDIASSRDPLDARCEALLCVLSPAAPAAPGDPAR